MAAPYLKANAKSTERLAKLVKSLTDDELKLVIYKEGWTVAVALAHMAFWDERRRVTLKLWKKKGVGRKPVIDDITNDILIPFLLSIPVKKAAELAVTTAEALDKEIAELPPAMVKAIEATKDELALNRADHRNSHMDEIDAFLKTKREA
jgi:hypothetical protein